MACAAYVRLASPVTYVSVGTLRTEASIGCRRGQNSPPARRSECTSGGIVTLSVALSFLAKTNEFGVEHLLVSREKQYQPVVAAPAFRIPVRM